MNFLLADDEIFALQDLEQVLRKALEILNIIEYDIQMAHSAGEALRISEQNPPDIACLDINMPGENGLSLAEELQKRNPRINLIFVTAYRQYALEALQLHTSGYLLKPIELQAMVKELRNLRFGELPAAKKSLRIQCFGNFEVYVNGMPWHFNRSKTKEFFALLVDRVGASVTVDEICAAIFEDFSADVKHKNTIRILAMELRHFLESCGAEDVYVHTRNAYSLKPEGISCDLYDYYNGKKELYKGKYMDQYSYWAWFKM